MEAMGVADAATGCECYGAELPAEEVDAYLAIEDDADFAAVASDAMKETSATCLPDVEIQ